MGRDNGPPRSGGEEAESVPPPDVRAALDGAPQEDVSRLVDPLMLVQRALAAEGERRRLRTDVRDEIAQDIMVYFWTKYIVKGEPFEWTSHAEFAAKLFDRALRNRRKRLKTRETTEVRWDYGDKRRKGADDYNGDNRGDGEGGHDNTPAPPGGWGDPEADLVAKQRAALIEAEIAKWSEAQRECWLQQQKGWDRKATAEERKITVNTVRFHRANCRKALRALRDRCDFPGDPPGPNGNNRRDTP